MKRGNIYFNNQQEVNQEKKEIIKNIRLNQSNHRVSENKKHKNSSQVDYKNLYKSVKRENEKLLKKVDMLLNSQRESKANFQKIKDAYQKTKKEIYSMKQDKIELLRQVKKLKSINTVIELDGSKIKKLLAQKQKELNHISQTIRILQKKIDEKNKKIEDQRAHIKGVQNIRDEKYLNKLRSLSNENNILKQKEQQLENINNRLLEQLDLYDNIDPKSMLQILYNRMTPSNYHQFEFINVLNRKLIFLKKKAWHEKKDNLTPKKVFGNVDLETMKLIDINGKEYKIDRLPNRFIRTGDAVAAIPKSNNNVDIYWIYESEEMMNTDIQLENNNPTSKKQNSRDKNEEFEYLGDYKVLILTGKNGKKYTNKLIKHGLRAEWMDPFEKSPVHVKEKMSSSDLIIICLDSIPHHVLNLIEDKSSYKYQLFNHHNEEKICNRVRLYVLQHYLNPKSIK